MNQMHEYLSKPINNVKQMKKTLNKLESVIGYSAYTGFLFI